MSEPRRIRTLWLAALAIAIGATTGHASQLLIGAATTSITPDKPVALSGQFHTRISRKPESPCTATALALESRDGDTVIDQAIMISCYLVAIRNTIQARFREHVKARLPGFPIRKVFLNATHTHTAPCMERGWYHYVIPKDGTMQPEEFAQFLFERLADIAVKAWESRKPGGVSYTLGHAVVAQNRRIVYDNGRTHMYGKTNSPTFSHIEGYEDHGVDMLFFWTPDKKLKAIVIDVPCPAQEVEGHRSVNADYWHDVRAMFHKKYGKDIPVVAWCGAGGDQSPHLMWRKRAEERMRRLRGISRTQEIARRVMAAVDSTIGFARKDIRTDVPFAHRVADIKLPRLMVTDKQLAVAKARHAKFAKRKNLTPVQRTHMSREKRLIDRYDDQKKNPLYDMELHVLRLGDVAIATSPFELFVDYGVQIKARSKAVQTFIIQLACNSGVYLPTERAIAGASYSATPHVSRVGPKGGKALVNHTVKAINALWAKPAKNTK